MHAQVKAVPAPLTSRKSSSIVTDRRDVLDKLLENSHMAHANQKPQPVVFELPITDDTPVWQQHPEVRKLHGMLVSAYGGALVEKPQTFSAEIKDRHGKVKFRITYSGFGPGANLAKTATIERLFTPTPSHS